MSEKVNFIFYGEWIDYFKEMSDREIAQTMRAIFNTVEEKEVGELKGTSAVTYKVIRNQIDRDVQKYREKCDKNRKNAEKRWQNNANAMPGECERNANASEKNANGMQTECERRVIKKKSNKENKKENEREIKRKEEYERGNKSAPALNQKPTIEEVKKACEELGLSTTVGEKFYYHYEANGWTQGRDKPVLNWVAQLNSWISREKEFKPKESTDKREAYKERKYSEEELAEMYDDLEKIEF